MKELKTYKSLRKLDPYEINNFRKFLKSPYFNSNQKLIALCDLYVSYIKKDITSKNVTEAQIIEDIKDLSLDLVTLRRYNNEIAKLLSEFFAQEELSKDKLLHNNLKLKGVSSRGITDLIKTSVRHAETGLSRYPEISAEYFYARYEYEKIISQLTTEIDKKRKKSRVQDQINIDLISDNLDQYYTIEKLKLYISLLSWKRSYKIDKEVKFIELIKGILSQQTNKDNKLLILLSTIVLTLEKPEEIRYFNLLRKQYSHYSKTLSLEDSKYIMDALIGYCVRKVNTGYAEFTPITVEVYKEAIDSEILFLHGSFTQITFNNVVMFACRNKEYEWAMKFVESYNQYLIEDERANSVSISSARIQFYSGNFSEVVAILSQIEYETVIYNLNSKSLLLFSYYEMKEIDALDSLINAFKVYLAREKSISSDRKKRYNQLLSFVKRIANVNPLDQRKIAQIKAKLIDTKGVLNKAWLLSKIEELER